VQQRTAPDVAPWECEKSNNDGVCCSVAPWKGENSDSRVRAQQDCNTETFPRVCVHCGEPERPGDPVQECALGDDRPHLLHRSCQAEWLGEVTPEPAPPSREASSPASDPWAIPDWLRRAPT
jgi:hypothetical protein